MHSALLLWQGSIDIAGWSHRVMLLHVDELRLPAFVLVSTCRLVHTGTPNTQPLSKFLRLFPSGEFCHPGFYLLSPS